MRHTPHASARWEPTTVPTVSPDDVLPVLRASSSAVMLTGAGMSTGSGIPDYRGPRAPKATPMLFQEFMADAANRRRYWARSMIGWQRTRHVRPNRAHHALVVWEREGTPCPLVGVITQNVDGLHEDAGQHRLITLHGRIADVICMDCRRNLARGAMQDMLRQLNPDVDPAHHDGGHAELRPDGDVAIDEWAGFSIPDCPRCGGILKPDVVFFGESAAAEDVQRAFGWVDRADVLVTLGTSLSVMSGLRFVKRAAKRGIPVVIVNHGRTRGDDVATHRVDAKVDDVLVGWQGHATTG